VVESRNVDWFLANHSLFERMIQTDVASIFRVNMKKLGKEMLIDETAGK
jgi:hypothetical protein